jgi:hypothetical protein
VTVTFDDMAASAANYSSRSMAMAAAVEAVSEDAF